MNAVKLSLEEQFHFQAMRAQVRQARNLEEMRSLTLKLIDLMETQKQTVLAMLQSQYLGCAQDLPAAGAEPLP